MDQSIINPLETRSRAYYRGRLFGGVLSWGYYQGRISTNGNIFDKDILDLVSVLISESISFVLELFIRERGGGGGETHLRKKGESL